MLKYNTPQELFTAICDIIRNKTSSNELINHQDIPSMIDELVDNDIINEYNELLSLITDHNIITELNNNEIENINISFTECTNLTTIDLPECTIINKCAFQRCTGLTTVNLPKCTSLGVSAFNSCTNLITVNLPECTSIGERAFASCTSLTTVNLPKCTSVSGTAFASCTSLTTVNLPKCTSVSGIAFAYCKNLTTLILNNDNRIVILENTNAFNNTPIAGYDGKTGYVYVPDNLVSFYKTATNWSNYANQIKPLSELPSELKEEYNL